MPFVNFSLDFRQNFDVRTFSRWLSIRGTKFFLRDIQKNFFSKIFTLILLDRFLDGFSKFGFFIGEICILIRDFWVIFENYSMHMLSIRGSILSHAEHTRNQFPSMLSIRGTNFRACSASGNMWAFLHVRGASKIKLKNVNKKRMATARRLIFGISQGIHCWSDYTVFFIIEKLWRQWRQRR